MNKDAWDEGCRRGIFGLVLTLLIFTPLAYAGVGLWEFLVVQALTIGVMGLWAVRLWVSPKPQFLWPPVVWAVLVWVAYAIGRYLTADVEYQARLELIQVLVFVVLFLAILNHLYHQDLMQIISYTLISVAMAASGYAVFQYLRHSTRVWALATREAGRASGPFLQPDHFCAFLAMILPLVLSLLLVGRIKPLTRVLLGYSFLVILGGVAVTFSRAGWAAALAGLLLVLLVLIGHRNHRLAAGACLAVLAAGGTWFVTHYLAATATFAQHINNPHTGLNLDVFIRTKIWVAGWHMWRDHPWWGVGPGLFDVYFNAYRPQTMQLRAGWAHCDYLNLLTDWGLAGGLIALTGVGLLLAGVARTWGRVRPAETDFGRSLSTRFAFFLGALGGLAALAVHCLVDFILHVPADALVAVTLLAFLSSSLRFATGRCWYNLRLPVKTAATVVLAAGMGYLGWQEYRLGHEAAWLARANQIGRYSPARARALQTALAYEPMNSVTAYELGECHRVIGFEDPTNSPASLDSALRWYRRSAQLNPHWELPWLRQGNTLDFLGQYDQAWPFYQEADRLDPNGYYVAANVGVHYLEERNFTAAQIWLLRSRTLRYQDNSIVVQSLPVVEREIAIDAGDLH